MTTGAPEGRDPGAPPGFGAVLRYFLQLGTSGFGGPIAVVGYMQRDLVQRRGWIAKEDFLNGVALGQTMPGPLAAQVAMWAGYMRRGAAAIFTPIWLGVVLPGRWFLRHRHNPQIKAFVTGATAAAGGALSGAVVVLTRQAVTDIPTTLIVLVTLGVLLRFKIGEPWIVAAAAALGLLLHWP
jgi:chromate transporter